MYKKLRLRVVFLYLCIAMYTVYNYIDIRVIV